MIRFTDGLPPSPAEGPAPGFEQRTGSRSQTEFWALHELRPIVGDHCFICGIETVGALQALSSIYRISPGTIDRANEDFRDALKEAGYHSPLMAPAAEKLRPELDGAVFAVPGTPVFANVTGEVLEKGHELSERVRGLLYVMCQHPTYHLR